MSPTERSPVDLNALKLFLDSLGTPKHKALILDPGRGRLIYHYTDLGALSSIVGNHELWLSNCQYSNDEDESRHGNEIARNVVGTYLEKAKKKRPRDPIMVEYAQALSSLVEKLPPEGFYICCFCEEDNLLSQWRSYGANGIGVSLGFDPMEFEAITGQDMPLGVMRLWKVFYEIDQQKDIVQRAIEYVWENRGAQNAQQLATRAADNIQFFVPTFKNADFREEKEHRLIFTPGPACPVKPHYRVGRGMLIPYYSVRSLAEAAGRGSPIAPWKLPLLTVMVGPSAQKRLNVESTKMLLQQNSYGLVEVSSSATPYRG